MTDRESDITATVLRERTRLGNFIRRRVRNPMEAEDILQDVFQDFVRAYRLPEPIEQVGAWLFRVARNRIIDRFRKKKHTDEELDPDLYLSLPTPDSGPEAVFARTVVLETMQRAVDELPVEQREVFTAHELDGKSFKEMAAETGIPINTLLARKRYAVLHLRGRLQTLYDELDL